MPYHIAQISTPPLYLAECLESGQLIWSQDPEDWREYGKSQARRINRFIKRRNIESQIEKSNDF